MGREIGRAVESAVTEPSGAVEAGAASGATVGVWSGSPHGEIICGSEPYEGVTDAVRSTSVARMPRCDHCDAHVSDRFARVFADARGQILACPNCSANAGIAEVSRQRAYETRP
jgi:hypothetical protein